VLRALARVNLAAIERNCARLASAAAPAALCAVVKADGYGHGAVPAARAAQAGGAAWLAVATAAEAAELRAAGIEGPLLVLGALSPEELDVALRARADVACWREAGARAIARWATELGVEPGVHVKLDTGMGRLGTRDADEATATGAAVAAAPGIRLAGVFTHFATADEADRGFLREQLAAFTAWADAMRERHHGLIAHAANSAATLAEPAARLDMVRCGIGIYGLDPFQRDPAEQGLEPALELLSYLAEVKPCAKGQSAGYGRRFVAERDTFLGTVPIGYGDGYRRGFTNNAEVVVDGRRVPVVGAVSMDNITVDLGPQPPRPGTTVTLIGDGLRAEELAARLDTINYEITCGLSRRVPRRHHRDGEPA
jgi:alanine racemase